jgi:predicted RNase H-like HicB family nuclease
VLELHRQTKPQGCQFSFSILQEASVRTGLSRRKTVAREFTVVIERDEEGYLVGSVPALKGCHTQAKSMDALIERMKEAIHLCLEVQGEKAGEPLELVGIQKVAV